MQVLCTQGHTEVYGSFSELEAMRVYPNQLLGLITHQKEEEEEDKEQFNIKDDQEPEDEGICYGCLQEVRTIHIIV